MNSAAPSGPVLSDAQRLAAIRASLDAIAPGQWSRAADGQGEFCETRGRKGELWVLARFDPGATGAEMEFCVGAPEAVRFLLELVDRAVAASRRQSAVGSRQSGEVGRAGGPAGDAPPDRLPTADCRLPNHAAEAAMLCASPAFMRFLHERHGLERPMTADRAAQRLRSVLGVVSRREINDGGAALAAWKELRRDFQVWKGRVVV